MSLDLQKSEKLRNSGEPEQPYRWDIQGLRGVAVLLVLFYHTKLLGFSGGFVGVDVFFVISGYLITRNICARFRAGTFTFVGFWASRLKRLFPASALVVLVVVLVSYWTNSGPAMQSILHDALYSSFGAMNINLIFQSFDYLNPNVGESPFMHFWSLGVEEQFYVAWPILLTLGLMIVKVGERSSVAAGLVLRIFTVTTFLIMTMTSFIAGVYYVSLEPTIAYFSPLLRAWEFLLGAALVFLPIRGLKSRNLRVLLSMTVGVAFVIAPAVVLNSDSVFPGFAALIPCLGTALLIVMNSSCSKRDDRLFMTNPILVFIGKHSYAIYLWHWPLGLFLEEMYPSANAVVVGVQTVGLSIWLAVMTHFLLDFPLQNITTKLGDILKTVAVVQALIVGLAFVLLADVEATRGSGGLATRVSFSNVEDSSFKASVRLGLETQEAPSNLTPPVASARQDVPGTEKDKCHLGFKMTEIGRCEYGKIDSNKIAVLIGDSHADQWQPALAASAGNAGVKLVSITKAACPIANVVLEEESLGREYYECAEWRASALERVKSLRPDIVFVGQSNRAIGDQVSDRQWYKETTDVLATLQQYSPQVVYLLDTPSPGIDVPQCVAENLDEMQKCNFDFANSDKYAYRNDGLEKYLRTKRFNYIDTVDWLCSSGRCPVVIGDTLIYRDSTHITKSFSLLLAPIFQQYLEKS